MIADKISMNSSSENYDRRFQQTKEKSEKNKLNFNTNSNGLEDYNLPFVIDDLLESLDKCHETASGPDDIPYRILKELPTEPLHVLLQLYNNIWEDGILPPSWKEATIIPIPKPGKDNTDPNNYRPIALTSCICKTMERMINARLVGYLESNGLITEYQSGFRSERSTTDHLIRLESFIRDAFIKKEHVIAIFFDLEKAYDTTWKYGIMKDLYDMGLRGSLPLFISDFLSDRQFRVRVGSTLSDLHEQEMGVPQGSILSVTLFNVKINSIIKCVSNNMNCSLYVDDFLLCYRSKTMNNAERNLQMNLNKVNNWALENGFRFSKTKTQCVHFCRQRSCYREPDLTIDGVKIPTADEVKFLGIIFDRKLTFIPHIKYLKAKCLKALNIMKVVASTDWGADRTVLLRLYRALVRSKLDYGCVVYGSTSPSYIKMLDTIHHQGLRLALGAFRTSPVQSLYVEANEPSLELRREKLSLQYAVKLKSNSKNPAYDAVFNPSFQNLYDLKPKAIRPFGLRIQGALNTLEFDPKNIHPSLMTEVSTWQLDTPCVRFDLTNNKKMNTNPEIFKSALNELKAEFHDHLPIYTDGSKDGAKVGCSVVSTIYTAKLRLPDNASIFSAEVKAIDIALKFIETVNNDKFIIFCDSLSVLQSLRNKNIRNPLIAKVLQKHSDLTPMKSIVYCWIPGHVGISGNEMADRAAKEALLLNISKTKIPYTDAKHAINTYLRTKWQTLWNNVPFNKLRSIKPTIGDSYNVCRTVRREEVIQTRLRIGHTRLTQLSAERR